MISCWSIWNFCPLEESQLFTTQSQVLTTLKNKILENMVGKGENDGTSFSTVS